MKAVLPRIMVWRVNESVCCIEQVMTFHKPHDLRRVEHGVIPEIMVSDYDNRSHTLVFQQPEKYCEKEKKAGCTKKNSVGRYQWNEHFNGDSSTEPTESVPQKATKIHNVLGSASNSSV